MKNTFSFFLSCFIFLFFTTCQQANNAEKETAENTSTETSKEQTPFIKGAVFEGANGVYFDKEDRLHVASVTGRNIGVVNTETGAIIDSYGPEQGIEGPDDLVIAEDGTIYFTSILTGEVGRRTPSGEVTKQMVAPGINPITLSEDGRLFAALDFSGDGLYELDPELKNPPKLIIKELGWLNGFDFGPDGKLYGPIWSKGHIVKIDVDKAKLDVIVDDLATPAAVKFNSKGELFTIDHFTGSVWKIDPTSGDKTEVAKIFGGADNLAFNSKDELFISSAQDGGVIQVNMDGTTRTVIENSFGNAGDLAIIDNQLWVPDILSLKSYDKNTGKAGDVMRHMIGRPGIMGPFTIDHEAGKIAMTSWFGNEVQVWDLQANKAIADYHDFPVPINAILTDGALIVAELGLAPGKAKISRQIGEKREVLMDATKGLIVPAGLAATNGNLYASDFYTGTIFQITENNELLDAPKVIAQGLKQPEGLTIGPKGNLLVAETGMNQVVSINSSNGEKTVLADNIPMGVPAVENMPPTWKMTEVTYDSEGNLFVPSDVENTIYKLEKVF